MGLQSLPPLSSASDRAVQQAVVALKKGAHLLKYGRSGKPKFCPFRLSMDEKFLLWYSGPDEKKLRLSKVTNIIHGKNNKQLQLEKGSQCLALIHANGKSSLELICKDEQQAESWFIGLRAVISRNYCNGNMKEERGAQSCINSPASFMRRKQILGLRTRSSEVHSSSGSPLSSFSARCTSDMSCSSDGFFSGSSLSNTRNALIQQEGAPKMHALKDVYIWGEGGCLGGGEAHANALLPKLLDSATMLDVRSISLGKKHAALVTNEGEVFCWGEGKRGRLGHKVDIDILRPKVVASLSGVDVIRTSCGTYQTYALTLSGEVYAWGDDYTHATLGEDSKRSHRLMKRLTSSLEGIAISNVACGEWHTAIVSVCGRLFTYGDGTFGVLGHGNIESYSRPKEVDSIKGLRVKNVACGAWHTAAVIEVTTGCVKPGNTSGKLFTWGDSDKGRLGHPDQERKLLPTRVARLLDHDFAQVACGDALTLGLTNTGRVFTIGSALHGQLGLPQAKDKSINAVKGRLIDEFVVEISSGSYHVVVLTSKGNVYAWGKGENGQLGLGDTKDRSSPCLVDALKGRKVETVACGASSTAAICAHKSLSLSDQLACRGCKNTFGFIRKKQNCYNCGRLFCRACSSKRSIYASLAPNENKPSRVCNECFNELQSVSSCVVLSKLETNTPRPITRKLNSKAEDPYPKHTRSRSSNTCTYDGDRSSERKDVTFRGEKLQTSDIVYTDKSLPRWGHVSCPHLFTNIRRDATMGSVQAAEKDEKSYICEEISKLKAQADSLEKLCEAREEEIQDNKRKIEEARLVIEEEAASFKEANEIIQMLTSKLCEMSEKISSGERVDDKARTKLPALPLPRTPQKAVEIEGRRGENPSSSSIVFSSKLRSVFGHSRMDSDKCSNVEWIEECEPGVFITFTALPDGKTGLRRIRFSRKNFDEREAKRWWEESKQAVCAKYGIDGYSIPNS